MKELALSLPATPLRQRIVCPSDPNCCLLFVLFSEMLLCWIIIIIIITYTALYSRASQPLSGPWHGSADQVAHC